MNDRPSNFLPNWLVVTNDGIRYTRPKEFAKDFDPWEVESMVVNGRVSRGNTFGFDWTTPFRCRASFENVTEQGGYQLTISGSITRSRCIYYNRADMQRGHIFTAVGFKYHLSNGAFAQILLHYGSSTEFRPKLLYVITAKEYPLEMSTPFELRNDGKVVLSVKKLNEIQHNYSNVELDICDSRIETFKLWE